MAVQDTSRAAYDELRPSLSERQASVLRGISAFYARHTRWPTAYELFRFMERDGTAKDLNDVRPRLTELKDAGQVLNPEIKRYCEVTRKRAFTWRLVATPTLF